MERKTLLLILFWCIDLYILLWNVSWLWKAQTRQIMVENQGAKSVDEVIFTFKIICGFNFFKPDINLELVENQISFWPGKFLENKHVCWFFCYIWSWLKKHIWGRWRGWGGGIQGKWILSGQVRIWLKPKGPKALMMWFVN